MNKEKLAKSLTGTLLFIAFSYLGVILVWVFYARYPALMDFTEWMYQAFLTRRLVAGHEGLEHQFYLAAYPIPNSFSQAGMAGLNFLTTPLFSGRLWLALYLCGWLGLGLLLARNKTAKLLLPVFFCSLAAGSSFWNGFINYQFSVLLFTFYVYLVYIKGRNTPLLTFIFSILLFLTHASSFCIFAGLVLFHQVYDRVRERGPGLSLRSLWPLSKKQYWHLSALGPAVLFWSFYVTHAVHQVPKAQAGLHSAQEYVLYKAYTLMKAGPFQNFVMPTGTSFLEGWPGLYWSGFGLNLIFALLLGLSLLILFAKIYFVKRDSLQTMRLHPLALSILLCLGLYLCLPAEFIVINLGERFLGIGIAAFFILSIKLNTLWRLPYYGMAIISVLVWPYYVWFLSWNALHVKKIQQRTEAGLVSKSRQEKNARKRAQALYPNTRYAYFNHRLYSYKDLFPILENEVISSDMPYHYSTSFLKKKKMK